ncbi:MFS transporter, partial [Patescibacteria group bacterium]
MGKTNNKTKSAKKIFNRIINVTSDEWPRIYLSWSIQFLFKVAYIVAWISLIAIFVTKFGIVYLPYFFIIYAFSRMIGAYFYSNILKRCRKDKLIIFTSLIGAVLFLLALFLNSINEGLFIFLSISVFAVFLSQIYILNSAFIEDLFTPLESERTFPVIESSETIGGIVGALIMAFLVPIIPTTNLISISVVCLALIAPIVLFHRTILKKVPFIKFDKSKETNETHLTTIKGFTSYFKSLPFLKVLLIVVIAQWLFTNLLEFQFTKAVYDNIAENIHNPAEELTHGLSSIHIFIYSFALIMQVLAASRIISTLGIIGSLLLHPLVTLLSLGTMLFKFGFPAAILTKLNFEMTSIIHKSAYHSSYYAIEPDTREQIREVLEGFSQPVGTIIGMSLLILLQYLFQGTLLNFAITISMITVMLAMLVILLKNENKYSQLSVKNLLHSKNSILQLNAVEVLGQKGHKNAAQILTKTLQENNLDEKVKIKILETLGHMKKHKSILEILDYIDDDSMKIRLAALKALYKFNVIHKKKSTRPFSLFRINNVLKRQFEKEENN